MSTSKRANKSYRIEGRSAYFRDKYGTSNPIITIECTDHEAFGRSWKWMQGNPAAMLFGMRTGMEGISTERGSVYYGKIGNMGELVHESELGDEI